MIVFGVQHLVYGQFVTRLVPKLPGWIHSQSRWAYVIGGALILAGAALLFRKYMGAAALFIAALGLGSLLCIYLPHLFAEPHNGALWTQAGKAVALSGCAFLAAGIFPSAGRLFVSAFLVVGGVQHFIYAKFVATLVPSWVPAHMFWTYFAGVALIAGGVGMIVPLTRWPAAFLSGLMIFAWVIMLHIPRAIGVPGDANETTAVFEALAMSAGCFLVAFGGRSK